MGNSHFFLPSKPDKKDSKQFIAIPVYAATYFIPARVYGKNSMDFQRGGKIVAGVFPDPELLVSSGMEQQERSRAYSRQRRNTVFTRELEYEGHSWLGFPNENSLNDRNGIGIVACHPLCTLVQRE